MIDENGERERGRLLARDYRNLAWACWTTPPIALFPFLLPVFEPSFIPQAIAEAWQIYLLFFGLPWAVGVVAWLHARRIDRETKN